MMKKIFGVILLSAFTCGATAQVSANLELTRSLENNAKGFGLGVSGQYLKGLGDKLALGGNLGFIYQIGLGEGITQFSVPMLGVVRYYLTGTHEDGGFYPEINLGAAMYHTRVKVNVLGTTVTGEETSLYPMLNFGAGYNLGNGMDLNARFGLIFGDNNTATYMGLRFCYTLGGK
jgi:hypothetical protein